MEQRQLIGMGGWDLLPFDRYFYPPDRPSGFRKLRFYSKFFDFVEVNTTFYNSSYPVQQVRRWIEDVSDNPSFVFTAKLFRGYTHELNASRDDYFSIRNLLDEFQKSGRFQGLVIQFPSSFTARAEAREYLSKLSTAFSSYRLFLDVRHRSWDHVAKGGFFEDHRLHLINVDLPSLAHHRPLSHHSSDGVSYFRMMGRNSLGWRNSFERSSVQNNDRYNYLYSSAELDELLENMNRLGKSIRQTFVVFHNDPEANSLVNGFQLKHRLKQQTHAEIPEKLLLFRSPGSLPPSRKDALYQSLPLFRKCS